MNWKLIAVIFIVIAILESILICYSLISYSNQIKETNECFWDICGDYPDAQYDNGICSCIDYDMFGNEIISHTEYMR